MPSFGFMAERKNIYFASDFHLGVYPFEKSLQREKTIVAWLDEIKEDASAIYLVGDIFDFWFEYSSVVPKGYIRFLGKLAELSDLGIQIVFFRGNHDMWMFDYFEKQLDATIIDNELELLLDGKTFYIHHGDGLGPGDSKYKTLKKIFRSKLCQWFFARLHPNLGIGIAKVWSRKSRAANNEAESFLGNDKEWLIQYTQELIDKGQVYDFYIYGHRHLPYDIQLRENIRVINLGEWLQHFTYAVWDGENLTLKRFS